VKDKRDECGCHKGCIVLDHVCPEGTKRCEWPACLTEAEHADLVDDLVRDELLGGAEGPLPPPGLTCPTEDV